MEKGYLSKFFKKVGFKQLSAVEISGKGSNQHEFNGSKELAAIFGYPLVKVKYPAKFLLVLEDNQSIASDGFVTWSDVRANHPTRTEYHLYYSDKEVIRSADIGDTVFIALQANDNVLVIITQPNSEAENQLKSLFGVSSKVPMKFQVRDYENNDRQQSEFLTRLILEIIGVEFEDPDANAIEEIIRPFVKLAKFPPTKEFSARARLTLPEVRAQDDPDSALDAWLLHEDKMFRALEQNLISERLKLGFVSEDGLADVESFLGFSGTIRQRRFSRMGLSLEHHLAAAFDAFGLSYSRTSETENRTKPDFLFPGQNEYWDSRFPLKNLVMMGSKSTCKDRWRQVLSEAKRIKRKHLFTLEPSISENQTNEMKANNLQLILPKSIHSSYTADQQSWLMNLSEFIKFVQKTQA